MTIRPATYDDLPTMRAIYAPHVYAGTASFEYTVPTLEQFTERFERITEHFPWLVAEENGEVLGYAYGDQIFSRAAYAWTADYALYIRGDAQGKGIGKALSLALEQELADIGVVNLLALITEDNAASIALHERLGYTHVGRMPHAGYKFGRWLGVVWMMKIIRDDAMPGPMPVPPKNG